MVAEALHNGELFFLRLPNKQPEVAYDILEIYVNTCLEVMGTDHKMFYLDKETILPEVESTIKFEKEVDDYMIGSLSDILSYMQSGRSQESVFNISYKTARFEPNLAEKASEFFPSGDVYFLPYMKHFSHSDQERIFVGEAIDEVGVLGVIPKQENLESFIDNWLGLALGCINRGLSKTYISALRVESGRNACLIKLSFDRCIEPEPPSYIF
jgi:hypothetical protein